MISHQDIPAAIKDFCDACSQRLRGLKDYTDCIDLARNELPRLLLDRTLMTRLMKNIAAGTGYPDVRVPTMFDNELILYLEQTRLYSLRMYLWGPGEYTAPHDHNSWGVIGTVSAGFEVINYRRDDDGSRAGHARLAEKETMELKPGQTASTLPLDQGIHKTGNPTRGTIITLSIYGRPLDRGYLQGFDVADNRVYRILPPKHKKMYLAAEALKDLKIGQDTASNRIDLGVC